MSIIWVFVKINQVFTLVLPIDLKMEFQIGKYARNETKLVWTKLLIFSNSYDLPLSNELEFDFAKKLTDCLL